MTAPPAGQSVINARLLAKPAPHNRVFFIFLQSVPYQSKT